MVPQQKRRNLADRSSALSQSGIKGVQAVFKMYVDVRNTESRISAKVISTKHLPSPVQLFQLQQCSICQPLCNPMLPVGHNLVQGCCKLHSAKDIDDKNRRKQPWSNFSCPPQSCPTSLAVPVSVMDFPDLHKGAARHPPLLGQEQVNSQSLHKLSLLWCPMGAAL